LPDWPLVVVVVIIIVNITAAAVGIVVHWCSFQTYRCLIIIIIASAIARVATGSTCHCLVIASIAAALARLATVVVFIIAAATAMA
jgi:hypothetical protein